MRRQNRLALVAGALSTAVVYVVLSLVPLFAPTVKEFVFDLTGAWLFGNPLEQLKLVGGLPGGFVAGYLAEDVFGADDPNAAIKYALYAVTAGLGFAYVATILLTVVLYGTALYIGILPMFVIVAPFYLVGGIVGGLLGNWFGGMLVDRSERAIDAERGSK